MRLNYARAINHGAYSISGRGSHSYGVSTLSNDLKLTVLAAELIDAITNLIYQ